MDVETEATDTPTYDVAIIGYGPTGATAANLLGRFGLKVAVIERDPDIYMRARAISIDEEVMRVWQSAGLADRLQPDMLPGQPIAFVDSEGRPFIEMTIKSKGSGHPPQQFIYQPAVDTVLRQGVARFPNVDVLVEHECLRVLNKSDHVELMLADLKADAFKRLQASYVIAADGGSSPTRAQLGIGYEGKTFAERWIVIDTKVHKIWDAHDRLRFHCDPERPTVDCPTPLSHHRWEFPIREDEDEQKMSSHQEIWKLLNAQGITEDNVEILRAVVYSHHVRFADRWRSGRTFLAGDAAHAMPPWLGQGMSAGVRDAANLCWKLAAVLRSQAPESLLDPYQSERMPHVKEVTRRAVFVGSVIKERHRPLVAVRNHGYRRLTKLPGVMGAFQKLWWIPDARYRKGFLGNGGSAIGWQLPQPMVSTTAGPARFDDVIGGQWALIHTGALPAGANAWTRLGAASFALNGPGTKPAADAIADHSGALTAWLRKKSCAAVVIRPDGFIYTAAAEGHALAAPPAGLANLTPPAKVETILNEASA